MRPACGRASRLAFATAGADDPRTRSASAEPSTAAPDPPKARVAASGNAANVATRDINSLHSGDGQRGCHHNMPTAWFCEEPLNGSQD